MAWSDRLEIYRRGVINRSDTREDFGKRLIARRSNINKPGNIFGLIKDEGKSQAERSSQVVRFRLSAGRTGPDGASVAAILR